MSKELEALEKIIQYNDLKNPVRGQTELIDTIEKSLKALEIIKKKRVDCLMIVLSQTYIEYNDMCEIEKDKLTQLEYDSLKEVLL